MNELDTRAVPWERVEFAYARNRAAAERPPPPRPGDRVLYRHRDWDATVYPAEVVQVQDPGVDVDDPNLWHLVRDVQGQPILQDGRPLIVAVADPWPWVRLRLDEPIEGHLVYQTWESRVRGSAGWLPLDYQRRPVRLPHQVVLQDLRPLMPAAAIQGRP